MRRVLLALSGLAVLTACEQTSPSLAEMSTPDPAEFLLAVPDPDFRLSLDQRAALAPIIDPDALENLLARVRPEYRGEILKNFNELGSQGPVALGPMSTRLPDEALRAAVAGIFRERGRGELPRP